MGVLDDAIREHLELKRRHGATDDEIARKEAEALGPARRGPAPAEETPAEAPDAAEPAAGESEAADEPRAARGPGGTVAAGDPHTGAEPEEAPEPYAVAEPALDEVEPEFGDELEAATGPSLADAATALGEGVPADREPEPEPEVPVAHTEPVLDDEEVDDAPEVEPTIDVRGEQEPPAAIEPVADPVEAAHPPVHDVDRDPLEPPAPVPDSHTVEFDTLGHREESAYPAASDEDVLEETPEFLRETPEHDRLWFEQKPPRDFDLDN